MVYKIINSKYGVFMQSLIFTLLIFFLGFSIGYFLESKRTENIVSAFSENEVEALDLRLQSEIFSNLESDHCEEAISQNLVIADKIYDIGLILEKYEEANQITDNLKIEKKKYVLLKNELWLNSIKLKEKCNNPFDTIVYFYEGEPSSSAKVSQQRILSNVLRDVKERNGNSVILLPIAGDLGLESVNFQMNYYNITELPAILINEKDKLEGFHDIEEIESLLNNRVINLNKA